LLIILLGHTAQSLGLIGGMQVAPFLGVGAALMLVTIMLLVLSDRQRNGVFTGNVAQAEPGEQRGRSDDFQAPAKPVVLEPAAGDSVSVEGTVAVSQHASGRTDMLVRGASGDRGDDENAGAALDAAAASQAEAPRPNLRTMAFRFRAGAREAAFTMSLSEHDPDRIARKAVGMARELLRRQGVAIGALEELEVLSLNVNPPAATEDALELENMAPVGLRLLPFEEQGRPLG
jgi:hypothetical protein